VKKPCTSIASYLGPQRRCASPARRASPHRRNLSPRGGAATAPSTRPADSEKERERGQLPDSKPSGTDAANPFRRQGPLDHGLHQPALGQVVRGRHQPVARRGGENFAEQLLGAVRLWRSRRDGTAVTMRQIEPSNRRGCRRAGSASRRVGAQTTRGGSAHIFDHTEHHRTNLGSAGSGVVDAV